MSELYSLTSSTQLLPVLTDFADAIAILAADGEALFQNERHSRWFGLIPPCFPQATHRHLFPEALYREDGSPFLAHEFPRAIRLASASSREAVARMQCIDDTERWLRIRSFPVNGAAGERWTVVTACDISELIARETKLKHQAHFDALTRLPNRVLFADRLQMMIAQSQRRRELLAICVLDLDGFKAVNDRHGHKAGDLLLREVAQRLSENVRNDDTVARLGGDEFALLLGGLISGQECEHLLRRVLNSLAQPYTVNGHVVSISASIGVTLFPNDGSDQEILVRHADQAMYQAKQAGKNRFTLYDNSPALRAQANLSMLHKIEKGIEKNQFRLHYQPQVDCRQGRVVGCEALIRWEHPLLGLLPPAEFLPLIENEETIVLLGEWVLRDGLAQLAEWLEQGLDIEVSVNISARHLHKREFVERLACIAHGYPRSVLEHLVIEIVETAALEDINAACDAIAECNELGIQVALDDFGTGYSSLVHLKRLAASELKIDQTFVKGMLEAPEDLAIVESVIGLANAFKRTAVAEGVESIDHILMLLELGCDIMQGFVFSRPMAAEYIPAWISNFQPDSLWQLSSSKRPNRDYFELLVAEAAHRSWIELLILRLRKSGQLGESEACLSPQACRFGQWIEREGGRRFENSPLFAEVIQVHDKLHACAIDYARALNNGPPAQATLAEKSLHEASSQLVALLRELREQFANTEEN